MALAERMLAARFNRPGHVVVDHRTWVIASDGDLMEGISHEAASLAGHLGLDRLCVFYDDNRITIDGRTDLSFSEDVAERFRAYDNQLLKSGATVSGWQVGVPKRTLDGVVVTPATRAVAGQFTYTPYAGAQWGGNDPQWGGVYLYFKHAPKVKVDLPAIAAPALVQPVAVQPAVVQPPALPAPGVTPVRPK